MRKKNVTPKGEEFPVRRPHVLETAKRLKRENPSRSDEECLIVAKQLWTAPKK